MQSKDLLAQQRLHIGELWHLAQSLKCTNSPLLCERQGPRGVIRMQPVDGNDLGDVVEIDALCESQEEVLVLLP